MARETKEQRDCEYLALASLTYAQRFTFPENLGSAIDRVPYRSRPATTMWAW